MPFKIRALSLAADALLVAAKKIKGAQYTPDGWLLLDKGTEVTETNSHGCFLSPSTSLCLLFQALPLTSVLLASAMCWVLQVSEAVHGPPGAISGGRDGRKYINSHVNLGMVMARTLEGKTRVRAQRCTVGDHL